MILIFFLAQKTFIQGISTTESKGNCWNYGSFSGPNDEGDRKADLSDCSQRLEYRNSKFRLP